MLANGKHESDSTINETLCKFWALHDTHDATTLPWCPTKKGLYKVPEGWSHASWEVGTVSTAAQKVSGMISCRSRWSKHSTLSLLAWSILKSKVSVEPEDYSFIQHQHTSLELLRIKNQCRMETGAQACHLADLESWKVWIKRSQVLVLATTKLARLTESPAGDIKVKVACRWCERCELHSTFLIRTILYQPGRDKDHWVIQPSWSRAISFCRVESHPASQKSNPPNYTQSPWQHCL